MPRRFLTEAAFADLARAEPGALSDVVVFRQSAAAPDLLAATDRTIPYVLSTAEVARDFHTIATGGWKLANYEANPVFLWAHDTTELPIGRMASISIVGDRLVGSVEYADADTYPFADTVFRMVKGRFLNAVSVSWNPLKWSYSTDRKRPGGIDFLEQDLLEVSQVPVPCLADALATARAAGIDTGPAVAWAERLLDSDGLTTIPRAELETLRRNAKMPVPSKPGVRLAPAAAVTPSAPAAASARTVRAGASAGKRGLYTVSYLAGALSELSWIQESIAYETEREGDGSDIAPRLLSLMQAFGKLLVDYTIEEVRELVGTDEEGDLLDPDVEVVEAVDTVERSAQQLLRGFSLIVRHAAMPAVTRAAAVGARTVASLDPAALAHMLRHDMLAPSGRAALADMILSRQGKVLSSDNETHLRDACDHMTRAMEKVQGVVDQNAPDPDPDDAAGDTTGAGDSGTARSGRVAPPAPAPAPTPAAGQLAAVADAARAKRERLAREARAAALAAQA